MSEGEYTDRYADIIDGLFCKPSAPFGGYIRNSPPSVVVPDLMFRAVVERSGDESDTYEVTVFEGIDGFAGELWDRTAKTMLRLRPLNHPGLPEIVTAHFLPERRLAFTMTRELGNPLDLDDAVHWAGENPLEAFEQFSILLDALRQMHGASIVHRNLLPGAFRQRRAGGKRDLSLARFEMSTLISNIIRRVVGGDATEVRSIVRKIYLADDSGPAASPINAARRLVYLPPEMHPYIFDDKQRTRRDWNSTDLFGLGVLGWELFCGGLPEVFPDQLRAVAEAQGSDRVSALVLLHEAMRSHLRAGADLPEPLSGVLQGMIDYRPDGRDTSFAHSVRIEKDWDSIRSRWERREDRPYVVAFMPEECHDTIYNQRGWISRSPREPAGRDALKAFFESELNNAFLVHCKTGARGYATGPDDVLAEAEWVLIGSKAVWFCAYLREPGRRERVREDVLVIKYLREHESALELFNAQPRRRIPAIKLVAFRPDQLPAALTEAIPSWRPLADSVKRQGTGDVKNDKYLQSLDFLLDYQRVVLDSRTFPFTSEPGEPGAPVRLHYDADRDDVWRHRNALLTAYAADRRRRPCFGDFVQGLDADTGTGQQEWITLDVDRRVDLPAFTGDVIEARVVKRIDEDTIEVSPLSQARIPAAGWLRPKADRGSRPHLARQYRARQALDNQSGLVTTLRAPSSFDMGRHRWTVDRGPGLDGNAREVVRDMLSVEPFYALQGPPGSGKTNAAARTLRLYLAAEAGARVLVSAQSNFALDNVADRLIKTLPPDTLILREAAENGRSAVKDSIKGHLLENLTKTVADEVQGKLAPVPADGAEEASQSDDEEPPWADDDPVRAAELRKLADRWRESVKSDQLELSELIKTGANVVLATCSIASTILTGADRLTDTFDWVFVEEAAKAWPTEVIIPLVLGSRWVLIGDHRQLGAHRGEDVANFLDSLQGHREDDVRLHFEAKAERLEALNLFKTLFERPVDPAAGADPGPQEPATPSAPSAPSAPAGPAGLATGLGRLTTQFRMHRDIAQPVRRAFYQRLPVRMDPDGLPESYLETAENEWTSRDHDVTRPRFLAGHPLVWIDTAGAEDCVEEPLWANKGEVELIDRMVTDMRPRPTPVATEGAQGEDEGDGSLVILTPYRHQLNLLRARGSLSGRVHTVHSFQGREADRVIVSLVRTTRSGDTPARNVGHVGQDEVANVLLSRAKRLLVIVGSLNHFAANGGSSWRTVTMAVRRYGHVVTPDEWSAW